MFAFAGISCLFFQKQDENLKSIINFKSNVDLKLINLMVLFMYKTVVITFLISQFIFSIMALCILMEQV